MTKAAHSTHPQQSPILANYTLRADVADELFDENGNMRPVWAKFISELGLLSEDDVAERFARADQYLKDAGVFYRQYSADAQQEREWPLSHIPVMLHESEWQDICQGLEQRAELLERIVADLFGPAHLIQNGHLPPELVAQNPEWHRPLVGVPPASGHFLHFVAFEVGRSPDGSWLVLGDRTQAPSGAAFALENRMATARVFPEPFPRSHVLRHAGFFRAFRDAMEGLPGAYGRLFALLSPGPGNETYYEHAYIARYLGMLLLEGEDLIVENGNVQVRTISGPQPVGTIWRRMDADYTDPLELNESSQIGTPGLVDAIRSGNLNVVNALGAGILETRAFLAFMPKIAEVLLGEPLRLPNIATWWCGQPSERAHVTANVDNMFIGDALSTALPYDIGLGSARSGTPPGMTRKELIKWIEANANTLVGQESVTLSTTPCWVDGQLQPRPMTVRVFAARTPDGWRFLPGGYARVGRNSNAAALSMQQGGQVADVWIMSDGETPADTLLGPDQFQRDESVALPSRAADNFFWLGRYVERTEGTIRLLRSYHLRFAEIGNPKDNRLKQFEKTLKSLGIDVSQPAQTDIGTTLYAAQRCAGRVRDRFSVDGWAALTDLVSSVEAISDTLRPGDDAARALSVLLHKITGFNGLVHENMHRSSAWRFLTLGRALERADGAAAVIETCATTDPEAGLLDLALEYGDSRITHQRRYRSHANRDSVVDLLGLDPQNPRSILFQITAMRRIASDLPFAKIKGHVSDVLGELLLLETNLTVLAQNQVTPDQLGAIRKSLANVSQHLSRTYLV